MPCFVLGCRVMHRTLRVLGCILASRVKTLSSWHTEAMKSASFTCLLKYVIHSISSHIIIWLYDCSMRYRQVSFEVIGYIFRHPLYKYYICKLSHQLLDRTDTVRAREAAGLFERVAE
jgi:hypothetical protein